MSTTPQRIGKYELQKLLGSGSAGEVWKSYDLQHRRNVAIKIFYPDLQSDPNFMKRLLSLGTNPHHQQGFASTASRSGGVQGEGQLLASLRHPNIVQILDVNIARPKEANSTVAYMVMEYIEGTTLADSIRNTSRKGAFPAVSDIVSLFTQLGAAIDYAHEQEIIHGNITPANILLRFPRSEEVRDTPITGGHKVPHPTPLLSRPYGSTGSSSSVPISYGEPVLTDFGVVRPTNGSVRNSALYMSPEQAKGLSPTRHSDIYALGIILYEICTGVPPFRSESPVVLMMQHIHMQPIPPTLINTNIPSELAAVILRALAKDSSTGFSSASQMATALADACSVHTVLNNAIVESKESGYDMTRRGQSIDTRSAEVPTVDVSALERSTGPLSTILGISTLPVRASEPAQLQSARVTRPLPVIPHRPTAVDAPERVGMSLSTVITGQVPARAVTRADTSAMGASAERVSILRPLRDMRSDARSRVTPPLSTIPGPMGRAFSIGEKDLETPPTMAVIPSSRVSASLSRTPSVPQLPLSLPPPKKVKRLSPIYIWLSSTLLLVILGSVVGTLFWLHSQSATPSRTVVGHIFFQDDSFGQNDVLRIELQNIPDPAPGKSYYAWLVIDGPGNSPTPTLLGKLPVSSGQVNFLYSGDAHHSDLLASVSGLLITQEDASGTPSFPSSKEVYTVEFAQATHPADTNHLSVLNSVRDLLSGDSALNKLGVSGGLAQWLLRDTSKAWLWASNARDYWQGTSTDNNALNFIRGQIVHIVDVLEGKRLDTRDAPIARVALLQQNAAAPDYLDASLSSLNAIASAPDATADQKARAHTIEGELVQVKNWLQRVHQDAIQLLNMTDSQFTQPQTQSLLDDMAMQANDAYNGQNGLSTNAMQHAGMAQIYTDIQRLATFEIIM